MATSRPPQRTSRSMLGLFTIYAVISLVPVLLLGFALASDYKHEATRRALETGRAESALVAQTAVQTQLDGEPITATMSGGQHDRLQRLVDEMVGERAILRLRLRDLNGRVVVAADTPSMSAPPSPEARAAASGATAVEVTRLNEDTDGGGGAGVQAIEVYRPVLAGTPARPVGVLELWLPYGPIQHNVESGLRTLYRNLIAGLGLLYLALSAITWSVCRHLRRQSEMNAFLAEHDILTELPNRILFHRRARRALAEGRPIAIAIIDLDGFKAVNDTLGHHNGDHLLVAVARRIQANVRPTDTVARLGGDEFGLVLRDAGDAADALGRIRALVDQEVELSGLSVSVAASIGYAIAPDDGDDLDDLLQRADRAMYVAKAERAGIVRYQRTQTDDRVTRPPGQWGETQAPVTV